MKIGLENQRINNSISREYVEYLKNQRNSLLQEYLDQRLGENYAEFQRIYLAQSKFNGGFNFCEGLVHNFIYIILIMVGCYLIIENQGINIGQLTFIISLVSMMSGAFNGVCGFVVKRIEYLQMSEIYENFIVLDNFDNKTGMTLSTIDSLNVNNKSLLSGKTYSREHIKTLLLENDEEHTFLINDVDIKHINPVSYLTKLFVINYNTKIAKNSIYQFLEPNNKILIEALNRFNVNMGANNCEDIYQQSLVNIISTISLKNRLIIFDDCFRYASTQHQE
jgi:hypothetical protein